MCDEPGTAGHAALSSHDMHVLMLAFIDAMKMMFL